MKLVKSYAFSTRQEGYNSLLFTSVLYDTSNPLESDLIALMSNRMGNANGKSEAIHTFMLFEFSKKRGDEHTTRTPRMFEWNSNYRQP